MHSKEDNFVPCIKLFPYTSYRQTFQEQYQTLKAALEKKVTGTAKNGARATTTKVGDGRGKRKQRLDLDGEERRAFIHPIKKHVSL